MKPHPADIDRDAILAQAVRFEVSLFLGRGQFVHASAPTLAEARIEADRLKAENPTTRLPLIYGVAANGRNAIVTSTQ